MRGGTSKGVYIMMNQYPKDPARRDAVALHGRLRLRRKMVFK
jgi:2-methylaconitate cis-trans-isomerase PrpF